MEGNDIRVAERTAHRQFEDLNRGYARLLLVPRSTDLAIVPQRADESPGRLVPNTAILPQRPNAALNLLGRGNATRAERRVMEAPAPVNRSIIEMAVRRDYTAIEEISIWDLVEFERSNWG